ncbi:MAG: hypothetical protein AAGJ81_05480 [Verrucomicrobiota bacterium]
MMRGVLLTFIFALFALGCASNSEYGIKADPLIDAAEGDETGGSLRDQITQENTRAREEGAEPIFRVEDDR